MLLGQQSLFHFIGRGISYFTRWFVPSLRRGRGCKQPLQRKWARAWRWRVKIAHKCSWKNLWAPREPTSERQASAPCAGAVTHQPHYLQSTKQRESLGGRTFPPLPITYRGKFKMLQYITFPAQQCWAHNLSPSETNEWTSLLLRWLLLLIDYGFLDTSSTFINILWEFFNGNGITPNDSTKSRSSSS